MKLNKQLIIENVNSLIEPFYIYHISNTDSYKDIRPLSFQKEGNKKIKDMLKKGYSISYMDEYSKEINAFLGPIKKKHIMDSINAGFEVWSGLKNKAYLYKINLNDPANILKIISINITSTPQQIEYDNKNWNKFKKETLTLDKDEFFKKKNIYIKERDSYLIKFGIKKAKNLQEFKKIIFLKDWSDMDKYFKKNISCGNKSQYASCIPHIQVKVSGPLKYENVEKI